MKARKTVLKEINRLQRIVQSEQLNSSKQGGAISRRGDEAYAMMTALLWTTYGRCDWTPSKAVKEPRSLAVEL